MPPEAVFFPSNSSVSYGSFSFPISNGSFLPYPGGLIVFAGVGDRHEDMCVWIYEISVTPSWATNETLLYQSKYDPNDLPYLTYLNLTDPALSLTQSLNLTDIPAGPQSVSVTVVEGGFEELGVPTPVGNSSVSTSAVLNFIVDSAPNMSVQEPENTFYITNNIPMLFTLDKTASWIGYSLDNLATVTATGNTTLTGLADGSHSLVIYANDSYGNTGKSNTVYFTIDTNPPNISNLSIENKTYATTQVPLAFNTNENTSWLGYSLDNQLNQTVDGNFTLSGLTEGTHSVVIYANDTFGYMEKSDTVLFIVDTTPPSISDLSIENKTYTTAQIPLTFSTNESTSWIGYSLDNLANQTVNGNFTLNGLSEGAHNLVIYANDTFGNMGKSDTLYFTIANPTPSPNKSTGYDAAKWIPYAIIALVIVLCLGVLVYFKKGKK
jgi:hypothetical protein